MEDAPKPADDAAPEAETDDEAVSDDEANEKVEDAPDA